MENYDPLLRPQEVAERLQIKVSTLATWRTLGNRNLRWNKIGSAVRYRESDVENFINENTH